MTVYVLVSTLQEDGARDTMIHGVYKSADKAREIFRDIIKENDCYFEKSQNPVIQDDYALSSKDYEDSDWMEVNILSFDVVE